MSWDLCVKKIHYNQSFFFCGTNFCLKKKNFMTNRKYFLFKSLKLCSSMIVSWDKQELFCVMYNSLKQAHMGAYFYEGFTWVVSLVVILDGKTWTLRLPYNLVYHVCLWTRYLKRLWTDSDETWWKGWVCNKDKLITFCWRSGSGSGHESFSNYLSDSSPLRERTKNDL